MLVWMCKGGLICNYGPGGKREGRKGMGKHGSIPHLTNTDTSGDIRTNSSFFFKKDIHYDAYLTY